MSQMPEPFRRLLVANRGEIAIRIMRAAAELSITTVAIYSKEDRLALHRHKADESYLVGRDKTPLEAYLDIDGIIRVARDVECDAIHPGYGFLAENPEFADACTAHGIAFVGPDAGVMRRLGNKVAARRIAEQAGVPVMPATNALATDPIEALAQAEAIGFPLMLKASWGGGGRGMRVVERPEDLEAAIAVARREAKTAFGSEEVYLEKLIERARHVEVQILGDHHGNLVHLYDRDCTVQRRHQKVVERAPAPYLDDDARAALCEAALTLGRAAGYRNAGTVEFLEDADTGLTYFIEVNPRIQVEHTVTEEVTGVDIVKAQLRIAQGGVIGESSSGVPRQEDIHLHGHALQCRVTTEEPENNFIPDYGRLTGYRSAGGFGIRLDGGSAFTGALITRFYDSLLVKVTASGMAPEDAAARMLRALGEFRVRGVATNLPFLARVVAHPQFLAADYTTRFIDETPELFHFPRRRDRVTRLLRHIAAVQVNGHPQVRGRPRPDTHFVPSPPVVPDTPPPDGTRQRLEALGAEGFARWMRAERRILLTDTTMRDAHQSLLATRMRSHDMFQVAPAYARLLPELFSVECWGGATFDVAMRFLNESPWERLEGLRARMPNLLLQMLLRASNGVGYTNYPDNVVRYFVEQAADAGVDLFRVFDSLNWVENMRIAMDAVLSTGKLCEASICYTGDITDPSRSKYSLDYYVGLARELERAGAHILGVKDMAGLVKPEAARVLFTALREAVSLPIHFHTHDTSGLSAASVLIAVEAGVDAVDGAMDALSGGTSQPNLGAIAAALRNHPRDPALDLGAMRAISNYWDQVRRCYVAFESEDRAPTSEVYLHEMPGGQYTNLREQARSLGLDARWPEVARAYADVNDMFGDIVKVTPSSKVVGDMALAMVTGGLTKQDVLDPKREVSFPASVVGYFRGEIGQPPGGFPAALQRKVLGDEPPIEGRPGKHLASVDLEAARRQAEETTGRSLDDRELASCLMYPDVFAEYAQYRAHHGNVTVLPTSVYFYGMDPDEEISVDLDPGKVVFIRYLARGEPDEEAMRPIYFEVNGQPRSVRVADESVAPLREALPKADAGDPSHVGAPMPGLVTSTVSAGASIERGDVLVTIEAMKMETTVRADRDGVVERVVAPAGTQVDSKDLLLVLEQD